MANNQTYDMPTYVYYYAGLENGAFYFMSGDNIVSYTATGPDAYPVNTDLPSGDSGGGVK